MESMSDKVRRILDYKGMSQAELARKMGVLPTSLNNKMQRNNLSERDLQAIAEGLDATFEGSFTLNESKQKF